MPFGWFKNQEITVVNFSFEHLMLFDTILERHRGSRLLPGSISCKYDGNDGKFVNNKVGYRSVVSKNEIT